MLDKNLFCGILKALKEQAKKMSKLEDALDQPIEWFWNAESDILELFETNSGATWSDDIWELVFDSNVSAEDVWLELEKSIPSLNELPNNLLIKDIIDKLFSHNTIISLNIEVADPTNPYCHQLQKIWQGEAWRLEREYPEYLNYKFIRFHCVVPESIVKSDLFIEVSPC